MNWNDGKSGYYVESGRYTVAMYVSHGKPQYLAWHKPEKGHAVMVGPMRGTQEEAKADAEAHNVREVTP